MCRPLATKVGSAISFEAAAGGCQVIAACFRNAGAVAASALLSGSVITVIAAGERWTDHSLRPAYEDLLGAGNVVDALVAGGAEPSVEALAAMAVRDARGDLSLRLAATDSSKELAALGFRDDAEFASQLDEGETVPILKDRAFISWT